MWLSFPSSGSKVLMLGVKMCRMDTMLGIILVFETEIHNYCSDFLSNVAWKFHQKSTGYTFTKMADANFDNFNVQLLPILNLLAA